MEHDKLRILTGLQHWLGSNYKDLPTDSGNMTKRAMLYLKKYPNTFDELSDQIIKEEKATALLADVVGRSEQLFCNCMANWPTFQSETGEIRCCNCKKEIAK